MLENNTELVIGPLVYKHQVQKITLQEQRGVEVLETARSSKNFIVDTNESSHRAQVRFIFTGLDEINRGVGEDNQSSGLRGLIALFRCAPFISIKNQYLSDAWRKHGKLTKDSYQSDDAEDKRYYSNIIPVAIERIHVENLPEIPFSFQVTLDITRIDIEPVTQNDVMLYLGQPITERPKAKNPVENPKDAYWLAKWIEDLLQGDNIPELRASDFDSADIAWYGRNAVGEALEDKRGLTLHLSTSTKEDKGVLLSESASINHKIAYNKLTGHMFPFASHMGTSARFMNMDIVFNGQQDSSDFREFNAFKQTSEEILKYKERYDRVIGWHVKTPVSKLLAVKKEIGNTLPGEKPWEGVFVPLNVYSETAEEPNMFNCRIELAENNVDFYDENEISMVAGGTDNDSLRKYFDSIIAKEQVFRQLLATDKQAALSQLLEPGEENYKYYQLFWPVEKGIVNLKVDSGYGLLNIDTLRAAILHYKVDPDRKIVNALRELDLAVGKLIANRRVTLTDRVTRNFDILVQGIAGIDFENPEVQVLFTAVKDLLRDKLFTTPISDERAEIWASFLVTGYLGDTRGILDTSSSTGRLIADLAAYEGVFTEDFVSALYLVITERRGKPKNLSQIYSTDGVYSAFQKLISYYTIEKDTALTLTDARREIVDRNRNLGKNSLYPELILPTYEQLFGPELWERYAPTFDDLGIEDYDDINEDSGEVVAVQPDDIVSPAIWYYSNRVKSNGDGGLKNLIKEATKVSDEVGQKLHLSVPFNTEQIKEIQELMEGDEQFQGEGGVLRRKTVADIIVDALYDYRKSDPKGFREDVLDVLTKPDDFAEKYLRGEQSLTVYLHNDGNYVIPRELNVPGLGAEIYRVINSRKKLVLDDKELPRLDRTEYRTPLQEEATFRRSQVGNTEKVLQNALSQLPDDQYSLERMFPAIKVFLIDRRGNEIIADDTLFNLNSIISVDITDDKQDAPLAVIKLADPLYTLQSDFFERKNVVSFNSEGDAKEENTKRILSSLKGPEQESHLKRYKLAQGRAVQIRMGYGSMAYNLPVVFTGRITEVVPGDQLTVVAQGWKAELINRKVSFYNDNPKNWGARDLAIQAITYADPEGMGERFPEFDSRFILRNLDSYSVSEAIRNSLSNYQNVDLETVGTRGIVSGLDSWFSSLLGLKTSDKDNKGFDTRLKNIWYPDTKIYRNVLGIRSSLGVMPSWINDSWIIPLQPAWDALQEASRHAWNCIAQVVPFDEQATIFMGHPDQPYFYTRGTEYSRRLYNKYIKTNRQDTKGILDALFSSFKQSKHFDQESKSAFEAIVRLQTKVDEYDAASQTRMGAANAFRTRPSSDLNLSLVDLKSLTEYVSLKKYAQGSGLKGFLFSREIADRIFDAVLASPLPDAKYNEVVSTLEVDKLMTFLFSRFFGIAIEELLIKWPNLEQTLSNYLISARRPDPKQAFSVEAARLNKATTFTSASTLARLNDEIFQVEQRVQNNPAGLASSISQGSFPTNILRTGNVVPSVGLDALRAVEQELLSFKVASANAYVSGPLKEAISTARRLEERFRSVLLAAPEGSGVVREENRPAGLTRLYADFRDPEGQATNQAVLDNLISARDALVAALNASTELSDSLLKDLGLEDRGTVSDIAVEQLDVFKVFVYFFCLHVLEDPIAQENTQKLTQKYPKLPPNMKTFRLIHYADDKSNIIQNKIVATTREMWNTVVIEHPAAGTADSTLSSEDQLYGRGVINAGANWVYYPKQEVTGVIGLQFHPGLTLSNKKVKVFTELNCQSVDLAAKLACGHLAEGIRRMYRGNLVLVGKHIKPHDRIILNDKYTRMKGPVEVESIVHHWNTQQGWITNISPQAVCDANPGAAILHTAAMEAAYEGVFNTLEFLSDAATIAIVIATLGAATPLAVGKFATRKAVTETAKRFLTKSPFKAVKETLKLNKERIGGFVSQFKKNGLRQLKDGQYLNTLRRLVASTAGPGQAYLQSQLAVAVGQFGTHTMMKANVISGFVESSKDVEQLPVILAPVIFNGNPFTAGLETDDAIWSISAFGLFYSAKDLQLGAKRFLEDIIGDN